MSTVVLKVRGRTILVLDIDEYNSAESGIQKYRLCLH